MFTSKRARFISPAFVLTLLLLASLACGITAPPTECSWSEGFGVVPPEIEEQAQQLFGATGVDGTLDLRPFGEKNSCDQSFHLMAVDFEFTLRVSDLRDDTSLAAIVAKVDPIPQLVMQGTPDVGKVRIWFETEDASCEWEKTTQQCD